MQYESIVVLLGKSIIQEEFIASSLKENREIAHLLISFQTCHCARVLCELQKLPTRFREVDKTFAVRHRHLI